MKLRLLLLLFAAWATLGGAAGAYIPGDPWTTTASGSVSAEGRPVTITWSIVRDGTSIPGEGGSNFIAYLDSIIGSGGGGANLTTRPWFPLVQAAFDRWEAVGGIDFQYSAQDDGAGLSGSVGQLNVRGDIRLGGANIDGASSTLAYAYLPEDGDIVLDTGETTFYSSSANNYRPLRNVLMHEIGHAFGLNHVTSTTSNLLLEPTNDNSIDGPQLDDVRAIQGLYGDVNEQSFNKQGNGVFGRATALGALSAGGTLRVGASAIVSSQAISATATDFVSIADSGDFDFYSLTIANPLSLSAVLTPRGGVFNQGSEGSTPTTFDANARNNLALTLFGPNGVTQLASAATAAVGLAESLTNITLAAAGTYYLRVSGADANVQLYDLRVTGQTLTPLLAGDYNNDGQVNAADYAVWRDQLGANITLPNDTTPGSVTAADYTVWRNAFGASSSSGLFAANAAVPEPPCVAILILAILMGTAIRTPLLNYALR